jgi:hypothetical protein
MQYQFPKETVHGHLKVFVEPLRNDVVGTIGQALHVRHTVNFIYQHNETLLG